MTYTTRDSVNKHQQHNSSKQTATAQFVDNRASTTTQLKQQTFMAASPKAIAQRAAINAMNASAVHRQKIIQRVAPEEELQMKSIHYSAQLAAMDEEKLLQGKFETAQRMEEEEPLQAKLETAQRVEKPNNTGLPNNLKSGIESLSGMSMDHVKVHYNSAKPAQLNAHAYAQGTDIHVAPGQEQHLPHEAWHVVQQAQGRVKPTLQMKGGVPVNDDVGLEREADVMGAKAKAGAVQLKVNGKGQIPTLSVLNVAQRYTPVIQRVEASEIMQAACYKLWELIKATHTTKSASLILNGLNVLATAVRYAKSDNSIGAQIGSGLVGLVLALDSAVTAVEEWRDADGEGKDMWKKRVDALEKVTTTLITAASLFALPFSPIVGGAIGGIGIAAVKTLRSGYDVLAQNWLFKSDSDQPKETDSLV